MLFSKIIIITLIVISAVVYAENTEKISDQILNLINNSENTVITNSKQITFVGPRAGEGYFSADAKKMIYQSERAPGNPFYQMYLLDFESGKSDLISTGFGKTTCGWIHPNNKTVMWSSTHLDQSTKKKTNAEYIERKNPVKGKYAWSFDEQFEIFSSDLNGKNIKQLTRSLGYDAEGSYSADGQKIIFASNRSAYDHTLTADETKKLAQDASYFMDIYIMDADGKNIKQLTSTKGYDGGPFFNADSTKITWRRFSEDGTRAEIYTMNADGTDQKPVTKLNAMSWAPFFHPSGDYIVFATSVLGFSNFELFIVDSHGLKKPVRVTFSDGFDGLASFSPDGKKITWSHKNSRGESQIYLADWSDEQARKILDLPAAKNNNLLSNLSSEININDTKSIVNYLASVDFKGRATGSLEEKIYTQKISDLFKKWGLTPAVGQNFIQPFEFISGVNIGKDNEVELNGRFQSKLKIGSDFQIVSHSKSGKFNSMPLVFSGFGIQAPANDHFSGYDSFKNLDVRNKWVVVLDGSPAPDNRNLKIHSELVPFSGLQHKISVAKKLGAFGIIILEEKISPLKFEGRLSESSIPVIKLSTLVFDKILNSDLKSDYKNFNLLKKSFDHYDFKSGFKIDSQYLSATVDLKTEKSTGLNVIGMINPLNLKTKALLIGAHGDHLGYGLSGASLATGAQNGFIHYGADDNASGVSGVLELAHHYSDLQHSKKITKPLVFAVWSGEEIGVLGSNHFVKTWKSDGFNKLDFNKTFFAGLNMDMIGRLQNQIFVQGLASAKEWTGMTEQLAITSNINIATTQDPYLPTDSMAIYLGKVPSISFFTGSHAFYHTPNDKPETLNYEGLIKSINLVKNFSDYLILPNTKLTYQAVEGDKGSKLQGRSFRIYLGTIPDYSQDGINGVKISGASKNSPAEISGLRAGDIIIEFDRTKIENIYDYVYTLQTVKPDIKTNIKVMRESKLIDLEIKPVLKE